jgi:hypothetical protein
MLLAAVRAARIQSANTAITAWSCDDPAPDGSGAWRLDRHNDTSHLATPPVPVV